MGKEPVSLDEVRYILSSSSIEPVIEEGDLDGGGRFSFQIPPANKLAEIASNVLSRERRVVEELSDKQVEQLAQRIGEATHQSVEEHREELVKAVEDATDTSNKKRVIELIVTGAVGKVLEIGLSNADVISDVVVEVLAKVL